MLLLGIMCYALMSGLKSMFDMKEEKMSIESDGKMEVSRKPSTDVQSDAVFRVTRGRFDSLRIYDVTEDELERIETGTPDSLNLTFATFLLSVALTCLTTLLTTTYSTKVFVLYLLLSIVGFLLGSFLLVKWWLLRKDRKAIFKKIRDRIE